MKGSILTGIILAIALLMLAGCQAPTCYPPNKILDNKCCIDDDDNSVCDYEEGGLQSTKSVEKVTDKAADVQEKESTTTVEEEDEEEYAAEPQIKTVKAPEPAPIKTGYVFGVQKIGLGEPQKYLEINKFSAYRTSRDKGLMDYMIFTVRNRGSNTMNAEVELLFEGARVDDSQARVKQEYSIPPLKPGEKYVHNQSLGIRFEHINLTKKVTLSVYEKYAAPREDLDIVVQNIVPTDYMETMEIYTYGITRV